MGHTEDLLPPPTAPTQQIQGDWVLFHPVYTSTELKAVEVSEKWRFKHMAVLIQHTGYPQNTSNIIRQIRVWTS
jgi:hypothetical protein